MNSWGGTERKKPEKIQEDTVFVGNHHRAVEGNNFDEGLFRSGWENYNRVSIQTDVMIWKPLNAVDLSDIPEDFDRTGAVFTSSMARRIAQLWWLFLR